MRALIEQNIAAFGIHIVQVFDDDAGGGFMYTVGNRRVGSPELYARAVEQGRVAAVAAIFNGLHASRDVRAGQAVTCGEDKYTLAAPSDAARIKSEDMLAAGIDGDFEVLELVPARLRPFAFTAPAPRCTCCGPAPAGLCRGRG
jgi:hypothetical protein